MLDWDEPASRCKVNDYSVILTLTNYDQCDHPNRQIKDTLVDSSNIKIHSLEYFSTYEVTIRARAADSDFATGDPNTIEVVTGEAAPSGPPENIKHRSPEDGELTLTWNLPQCGQRHGNIIKYEYRYWLDLHADEIRGDNTTDREVNFFGLMSNRTYMFQVRAYTEKGPGPYSESYEASAKGSTTGNTAAVVGGVFGGLIGIAAITVLVIVVFFFVVKRKRKDEELGDQTDQNQTGVHYSNTGHEQVETVDIPKPSDNNAATAKQSTKPKAIVKPIPEQMDMPSRNQPVEVKDLMEYVEINKAGGPDHGLKKDFEALPKSDEELHPCTVAKKPELKTKNRYKNIIPYDHSRVVLEFQDGDEHSDYINASYINGYKKDNAYIAAQGPNTATVKDFWRMIWQERTEIIIMVTSVVEGGKKKCEQYWPDKDNLAAYGDYSVTNVKEDCKEYYTVRELKLSKTEIYANQQSSDEVHAIKHFHYTGWPDMRVPDFAEPILGFLDHVNAENSPNAGPIIVHCSAGIGRTGTFITLDAMLKMARAEEKVDVFNFVNNMRQQRPGMIQTEPQYVFVFDALIEVLFCGKTTIPTSEVEHAWKAVEGAINGEDNHIIGQFKALNSMYPAPSEKQSAKGKTEENLAKSRHSSCIPPDSIRPRLATPGGEGSNDFINASFCHGHEERSMYLTTQVPLSNTVEDFWRLITDYQCHTIVVLNHPDDDDKSYGIYFPLEGLMTCGQFTVETVDVENNKNTIERKIRYYKTDKPKSAKEVRLVQYTEWPVKPSLPSSATSFVYLIDRVDVHRRDAENKKVVVVDSDGVSRCGLFCAVMSVICQIKEKQEVDVFRAVKQLKVCRHEMIKSMEQYTFCYDAARMYLQSFETYANFM